MLKLNEIFSKLFENRKLLYLKGVFLLNRCLEIDKDSIGLTTIKNIIIICIENSKILIKILPYTMTIDNFKKYENTGVKQYFIDIDDNWTENLIKLLSKIDEMYQHWNELIEISASDPYIYLEPLFPIEDSKKQKEIAEMLKKEYYNDDRRRYSISMGGNMFEKTIEYNNKVYFILDKYINEVVEMRLCNDYDGKTDKYGIYIGEPIEEIAKRCNLIKINDNQYEIEGINKLYLLIFDNKVKEIVIYFYSKYRRIEEKIQYIKDKYNKVIEFNEEYLYDAKKNIEDNIYSNQIMLNGCVGGLKPGKYHYEYLDFFANREYEYLSPDKKRGHYKTYNIVGLYRYKSLELTKTEDIFGISFISRVKENRIVKIVLGKGFIGTIENTGIGIGSNLKELKKTYGKRVKQIYEDYYQVEKLLLKTDENKNILEIILCE